MLDESMTLSDEPRFPKSLYLIHPLFSAYELNPVSIHAQASVAVPDGLDLDSWIVPPPREVLPQPRAEDDFDGEKKKKKSKKGKGKETTSSTNSKKKKANDADDLVILAPAESDHESPEDIAERERVCLLYDVAITYSTITLLSARQNDWHNYEMTHTISSTISPPKPRLKTLILSQWLS